MLQMQLTTAPPTHWLSSRAGRPRLDAGVLRTLYGFNASTYEENHMHDNRIRASAMILSIAFAACASAPSSESTSTQDVTGCPQVLLCCDSAQYFNIFDPFTVLAAQMIPGLNTNEVIGRGCSPPTPAGACDAQEPLCCGIATSLPGYGPVGANCIPIVD